MMDLSAYELVARPERVTQIPGGQELIVAEICAALVAPGVNGVFLPFYSSGALAHALLTRLNLMVRSDPTQDRYDGVPEDTQAIYFGTPTIVGGCALFPQKEEWDVEKERRTVRNLCAKAADAGYLRIVSGLGSGDITCEDRIADMKQPSGYEMPEIVCMKRFEKFTDWVFLMRRLS
jgi:hypothetical protein